MDDLSYVSLRSFTENVGHALVHYDLFLWAMPLEILVWHATFRRLRVELIFALVLKGTEPVFTWAGPVFTWAWPLSGTWVRPVSIMRYQTKVMTTT